MDTFIPPYPRERYAKCIEASKRVRWEIESDLIRGREFDYELKFLPDRLSLMDRFDFLNGAEKRLLSQVQGRTYANMFALVERFISTKMLEVTRSHALGDQVVVESLVRFTDEELKHQELFRRLEAMMAGRMPAGYTFMPNPNDVANLVLGKSTWAVLALTCHIEMFSIEHYRQSIDTDPEQQGLWKDVFLFHMREEAQHAVLDEMEWKREHAKLDGRQRDAAVAELIELVGAVDGMVGVQAAADAQYFAAINARKLDAASQARLSAGLVAAYRWQYILTGAQNERFTSLLSSLLDPVQLARVTGALGPIAEAVAAA